MSIFHSVLRTTDASTRIVGRVVDHCLQLTQRGAIGVLLFHRVGDFNPQPTWNIGRRSFERILRGLLQRGLIPHRLGDVVAGEVRTDRPGFVVSFDDGYRCVLTQALPILKRLEIPATLFLTTGQIGQLAPFWVDDWEARGRPTVAPDAWRPLNLQDCRQLKSSGLIDFGSHTHSHRDFRGKPSGLAEDLVVSKAWLQDNQLAEEAVPFAFPYGNSRLGFCGRALRAAVKASEMSCALTADPRLITPNTDRFKLGRFLVRGEDTFQSVYYRLNAGYTQAKGVVRAASAWGQRLVSDRPGAPKIEPLVIDQRPDEVRAAERDLVSTSSGKCLPGP